MNTNAAFKATEPLNQAGKEFVISNDKLVLAEIYQPSCLISIWQRDIYFAIQQYVNHLLSDNNNPMKIHQQITGSAEIKSWLEECLPSGNISAQLADGRKALISDVYHLVEMFEYLFEAKQVGVRIGKVEKQTCPKFHQDHVLCRLVTTYAGSCTQWIGSEHYQPGTSNETIDDSAIHSLNLFDVALLKGSAWADAANGCYHRSPPASTLSPRFFLSVDLIG